MADGVTIVDYGMGNLRSVSKAIESLGGAATVTSDPKAVGQAKKVILPGVGAFPAAMQELRARKLIEPIREAIGRGVPYLGICLGLQLLFETSDEGQGATGLAVLKGSVKRFHANGLKVPHMGWNQIEAPGTRDQGREACPLLAQVPNGSFVYFVHSYYVAPADPTLVALESEYGGRFPAMVWRDRLFATQFHPEKSQAVGLALLRNFLAL